jgi:hypothetical protein
MPAAIAAQNRRCSSRPATTGRPGENNSARPDRSERRLCFLIATPPFKVLRRSFESSQYAAHAYRRLLAGHGMRCSMSRKADCWDNAPMESFFGSMKTELDDASGYQTRQAARSGLFQFIEGFYNCHRLHSAIGYMTPMQKEQLAAAA